MMEGYMLGGENMAEHSLKEEITAALGKEEAEDFSWKFRAAFFDQTDVARIRELGANCVRIPFNYRLLEESQPNGKSGLNYLETVVGWFAAEQLYVILDMHAVPGSQNKDWHSDSDGIAHFYENKMYPDYFVDLWKELSGTFKDNPWVAGYDIMNEPVTANTDLVKDAYLRVISAIRENKDNHIIFLEGNNWAREVEFLRDCIQANVAYSIHFYEPTKFSFQEDRNSTYPGTIDGKQWDRQAIFDYLEPYSKLGAPIYVGEFGVSSLIPDYQWVKDTLAAFKHFDFHFTYWTYKSVAGMQFPDGIYQSFDEKGHFGTRTNQHGFKNITNQLKSDKKMFFEALKTPNFRLNEKLVKLLKSA